MLSGIGSKGKEIIEYQITNGLISDLPMALKKDVNLKYLHDFDPLQTAGQVNQPVLIINGEKDKNVPPTDAFKLSEAINKNGNLNVTVKVLPSYNHLLLKVDSLGLKTKFDKISSLALPDEVLELILEWLTNEI